MYAEQYNVFDLFQRMTESLVVDLPTDPLRYMADWLKIDSTRKIHAAIIGPPGSGKRMLGQSDEFFVNLVQVDLKSSITFSYRGLSEISQFLHKF